jgi:hypothetical protein
MDTAVFVICLAFTRMHAVETQTSVSGGPAGRNPDFSVRRRTGRTPDFSVRGTTGLAGVEGAGRAASFQHPSPSLSSRQETRATEALLRRRRHRVLSLSALGDDGQDRHRVEVLRRRCLLRRRLRRM